MSATFARAYIPLSHQATLAELSEFIPESLVHRMLYGLNYLNQVNVLDGFRQYEEAKIEKTIERYEQRLGNAATLLSSLEEVLGKRETPYRDTAIPSDPRRSRDRNEKHPISTKPMDAHGENNETFKPKPLYPGVNLNVKKYGGSEEDHLAYWILQVRNAIDLMDITDEKRRVIFAVANLKGEARDWYFNCKILNPDAFSTFDTFVTELKAHFNPPWYDFMILRKTMNTKQGSLSIRDYSIEMRSLFARQPDPNRYFDSTRVAIFFNGLNHGPARDAIEQRTSETYEKAVKIALEIDYRCRSHHSNTSSDSRPRDSKPGRRNADDDQF
ncbi:hypothetical protein AeMF1_006251 [Aphanomyces euteiches]|nr:hypothetical protein AeMF1_019956 [Aphanomyces euteiches]KAH9111790.1 hypothetical protein AeMF1_013783 [Aphanomyces euteiches]KAH9118457.1 hypothetical protein AeMF1_008406 [Aphanomyces euteiches]KAH9121923.1 hypothetical protein AeMF1_006563 [Aphanomyces euteiches]KAH9122475.1 hypothetical protein AeMF1_006251 [Aphanomyces euteiches]